MQWTNEPPTMEFSVYQVVVDIERSAYIHVPKTITLPELVEGLDFWLGWVRSIVERSQTNNDKDCRWMYDAMW
jgi:hypothetical protein